MKLIQGTKEQADRERESRRAARKARYRDIMLNSMEPAKVFHAAVRWYGMREKWETDSLSEYQIYNSMLQLVAEEFTPAWLAREFPAVKDYRGHTYGAKDYYTCMETLRKYAGSTWTTEDVQLFLWEWDCHALIGFTIAGLYIMDELRAMQGEPSLMQEFADSMGVKVYHSTKLAGGKEILLDEDGRSVGVLRKSHKHLKAVK